MTISKSDWWHVRHVRQQLLRWETEFALIFDWIFMSVPKVMGAPLYDCSEWQFWSCFVVLNVTCEKVDNLAQLSCEIKLFLQATRNLENSWTAVRQATLGILLRWQTLNFSTCKCLGKRWKCISFDGSCSFCQLSLITFRIQLCWIHRIYEATTHVPSI